MGRYLAFSIIAALACLAPAQGGMGGGGFQGGGSQGGARQQAYDRSVQAIENAVNSYVNADEIKNILTPGEFSEWSLDLKAGQVIVADARSEAVDPALEIVDSKEKVLATNDDRYPGDQRPLLLWRCSEDGKYSLRARCFQNKAGGQFFVRFNTYESYTVGNEQGAEYPLDPAKSRFLIRIPMKAGQVKQLRFEDPSKGRGGYPFPALELTIAPNGLPTLNNGSQFTNIINNVTVAPVAGDYYILASTYTGNNAKIRVAAREIVPVPLSGEAKATTNQPGLWSVQVKAGELAEISAPELSLSSRIAVFEAPDFSKYDLKKAETNPFFPNPKEKDSEKGPALQTLPARARDGRIQVFGVRRDATLWIATNGLGPADTQYTLSLKPAAAPLAEQGKATAKLRIGNTDYWAFDAKVGDVMSFDTSATGFAERVVTLDPSFQQISAYTALPDQTNGDWNLIIETPGRYLVAVSAIGDGGGGDYSLTRRVFSARDFSKGSPAQAEIKPGEVQVWKFTAKPNDPILVRWRSMGAGYNMAIRLADGRLASLPLTYIDEANRYGILTVLEPTTYLIVLTGGKGASSYSIELSDLPGYKKE